MLYKNILKYSASALIAIAIFLAFNLFNNNIPTDEDESNCFTESDTMAITICLEEILSFWKLEMNSLLIMAHDDVKENQKLWLLYKQNQVNIINNQYSGSGTSTIYLLLIPIIQMYKRRVQELKLTLTPISIHGN